MTTQTPPPLKESAQTAINQFLETLEGQSVCDLYDMVLAQVEEPLLIAVMDYVQHNQSKAAAILGLNRGTLRKKLRQYGLLDPAAQPRK
jgi:Fis family transcriptional regulator